MKNGYNCEENWGRSSVWLERLPVTQEVLPTNREVSSVGQVFSFCLIFLYL